MSYFRGDPYIWQDGDLNVHIWTDLRGHEWHNKIMLSAAVVDEMSAIRVAEMIETGRFAEIAHRAADSGNAGGLYRKTLGELRRRLASLMGVAA
jgi:hypothetical protein